MQIIEAKRRGKHARRVTLSKVVDVIVGYLGDMTLYFVIDASLTTVIPGIGRLSRFFLAVAGLVFLKRGLIVYLRQD